MVMFWISSFSRVRRSHLPASRKAFWSRSRSRRFQLQVVSDPGQHDGGVIGLWM